MRPISLPPDAGRRIAKKLASALEGDRQRVLEEALVAEFINEGDRLRQAQAAATAPEKAEEFRLARVRLGAEARLLGEQLKEEAEVTMADPAAVSDRLAALEARWRETGNAVYVWRTLDVWLNVKKAGAEPLPPWCTDYIATAARNLARVERQARPRKAAKRQRFGNLVAAALQLSRRGSNAFIAAQREDQRSEIARLAGIIRSVGISAARANAAAGGLVRVNDPRAQQRTVARGRAALKASKREG